MKLATLEIPAQPEFVSVARLVVSSVAGDRYEMTDDQLESLKLAVSEACTMAMHSRDASRPGRVAIECAGDADRIDITIGSEGSDFSQDSVKAHSPGIVDGRDLDNEFGLPFIGSLVDEYAVEEHEGANRLHLTVFSELAEEL